jgi:hypothetical protein
LKDDLIFADEEGVHRGHPQALMLELLSILHLISSFSNPYT